MDGSEGVGIAVQVAGTVRSSSRSSRGRNHALGRWDGRVLRVERRDMGRVSFMVTGRDGTIRLRAGRAAGAPGRENVSSMAVDCGQGDERITVWAAVSQGPSGLRGYCS